MNQLDPETTRLYLLGRLEPEKLAECEERLLADETFYDELSIAEDELTDEYLADELADEERRSFEEHFLSAPERRQKLHFARSLRRYVADSAPKQNDEVVSVDPPKRPHEIELRRRKRSGFWFLAQQNRLLAYSLAAVVLVVVGVSLVTLRNWSNPVPAGPGNLLTVVLTPGLTRDGGGGA